MLRLILSSLLFFSVAFAQQPQVLPEQVLTITNFGGLNTLDGDFTIKPNEFRYLTNWDLIRNRGSLTKRLGFDSVGTVGKTGHTIDSLLGIFGAPFSDGRQRLVMVGDSTGVGYGNIYVTNYGSVNVGNASADSITRLATYWGVQNVTEFQMLRDDIFLSNGQQRPMIIHDGVAKTFPARAGGEPLVVPLKQTNGEVNGEFLYTILVKPETTAAVLDTEHLSPEWRTAIRNDTRKQGLSLYRNGVLTAPSYVANGRFLITDFREPTRDTLSYFDRVFGFIQIDSVKNGFQYWVGATGIAPDSSYYTSDGSATLAEIVSNLRDSINADTVGTEVGDVFTAVKVGDSTLMLYTPAAMATDFYFKSPYIGGVCFTRGNLKLYRSTPNDQIIQYGDSADLIKTITWSNWLPVTWDTVKIIDSIAGGSPFDALLFTGDRFGRNPTEGMTYRYGSLKFISSQDTSAAAQGMFKGWPFKQRDTLGFYYTYTYIDTAISMEGDTARSLYVYADTAGTNKKLRSVSLRLPRPPTLETNLILNLYRGCIIQQTHDSGFTKLDSTFFYAGIPIELQQRGYGSFQSSNSRIPALDDAGLLSHTQVRRKWVDILAVDSTIGGTLYLVAQLKVTDTIFIDSLNQDSLIVKRPYRKASAPARLKNLTAVGDRLYGSVGSRLYFSYLDSGTAWGAFSFISLDESDGDEITAIHQARDAIRVYKNKKEFNIFQDDLGRWNRTEVSGYIGCVAPRSVVSGLGGTYYLSERGVIRETEGQYRDRTFGLELVSDKIRAIKDYAIDKKRACVTHYLSNGTVLFSFPTEDTTFAYFEDVNAWATWTFDIGGATNYAKEISSNYANAQFLPMDTMYFFKPGGKKIYRYGSSEKDDGGLIQSSATSAPVFTENLSVFKTVNRIGLGVRASIADTLLVTLVNEEDSIIVSNVRFNNLKKRYDVRGIPPSQALFWQYKFFDYYPISQLNDAIIDRIDLYYTEQGREIIK